MTLHPLRRWILAALVVGIPGVAAELLLLGHYEEPFQWTPLVLLALGAVAVGWVLIRPGRLGLLLLNVLGLLYLGSGALGVLLHYRGNAEFEREMYPDRAGFELIRESLTGATPALAPGTMMLLGMLVLAFAYRHPAGGGTELNP
ncbi:MAG: hypothetical protein RH859_06455 [Longimicrobiales bacterium]